MKYVMMQPSVLRFEWELQIVIHNLLSHGVHKEDIVILFSKHDDNVATNIKNIGVNVHVYEDKRDYGLYIPSLKPYLMWQYLEEDKSRENETYFYMDSDVIFRELPDPKQHMFTNDKEICYGSDCGGYLNYDYMIQCSNGKEIIQDMCNIVGITVEQVMSINEKSIGAQYIISKPKAEYFKKVYNDSNALWRYIEHKNTDMQKWTVEMTSQLWNLIYFNIEPKISQDLDFSWATDHYDEYYNKKILHNAGVIDEYQNLFFKGQYTDRVPFYDDFEHIFIDSNSMHYVNELNKTREWLEDNQYFKGEK